MALTHNVTDLSLIYQFLTSYDVNFSSSLILFSDIFFLGGGGGGGGVAKRFSSRVFVPEFMYGGFLPKEGLSKDRQFCAFSGLGEKNKV